LQRIEALGPQRVYSDPKLRVKKDYVAFLKHLIGIGLVDLSVETAVELWASFSFGRSRTSSGSSLTVGEATIILGPPLLSA
jgi:hypothetical protein